MEYNCTSFIFDDIKIEETSPVPPCVTPEFKYDNEHMNNNNIYLDLVQIMLKCYKNNFEYKYGLSEENDMSYFECADCGRSFDTKNEIEKHFLTCTEIAKHNLNNKSEVFVCQHCGNVYKHKRSLQKHLHMCKVKDSFLNETKGDFNIKFQSEAELKFHLRICENNSTCPRNCRSSEPFSCTKCNKCFKKVRSLYAHLKSHSTVKYKCNKCRLECKTQRFLLLHMKKCTFEGDITDCNRKFQTDSELRQHLRLCNNTSSQKHCTSVRPFVCQLCGKHLKLGKYLTAHLLGHSQTTYECKNCTKTYKKKESLANHFKDCNGRKFEGDIADCNRKFQTDTELKEHLKFCKNSSSSSKNCTDVRPFCCKLCGARFKKGMYLTAHLPNHSEAKYECNKCGKIYKTEEPLTKHLNYCKSFGGDITNCNRKFQTDAELNEHIKICKTSSDSPKICNSMKPFCCKLCDSTFASRSYLAQHLVNHSQERFLCDMCNTLLKTQESLDRHVQEYHRIEGDITDCNRKFQTYEELGRHLKICKNVSDSPKNCTSAKPLCCKLCDSRFSQKKHLTQHASVHAEKKYECVTCGLKYRHVSMLWRHERTHVGKLYHCLKCDKSYTRSDGLRRHVMNHDKEVKHQNNYVCGLCDASYSKCSDLRSHLMLHARGKLFRCKICEKSHHNADLLVSHMRGHPSIETYSCKLCQKDFLYEFELQEHLKKHDETDRQQ